MPDREKDGDCKTHHKTAAGSIIFNEIATISDLVIGAKEIWMNFLHKGRLLLILTHAVHHQKAILIQLTFEGMEHECVKRAGYGTTPQDVLPVCPGGPKKIIFPIDHKYNRDTSNCKKVVVL